MQLAAHNSIPSYMKIFFKFWWDSELDETISKLGQLIRVRCGRLLVGRAAGQFSTNRDGTNLPIEWLSVIAEWARNCFIPMSCMKR